MIWVIFNINCFSIFAMLNRFQHMRLQSVKSFLLCYGGKNKKIVLSRKSFGQDLFKKPKTRPIKVGLRPCAAPRPEQKMSWGKFIQA